MKTPEKTRLLQQIAAIPAMVPGTLSMFAIPGRSAAAGPYHKLQHWRDGKNHTRHVPAEELAAVQAAVAGYDRYQQLTRQYADLVIAETHATLAGVKKKDPAPDLLLAQDEEIQKLMAGFLAAAVQGETVAQLEVMVRTAVFQSANALFGWLLQQAADRADARYQARPGEIYKGRVTRQVQGIFGSSPVARDYYYHPGKQQGHYPADAALGLEVGYTPALAKLLVLEGAEEATYLKAEQQLERIGGIQVSARQIQRVIQRVGGDAQAWQARAAQPGPCDAAVLYASADGTGVPMVPEELQGRRGKQADGAAKTRQVYLGCVFTQHKTDADGHPVRDHDATTYVSSFQTIDEFGPLLRQEAIRRGLGDAAQTVLLIDGAAGLENMGKLCFKDSTQIVDYYHALEHAGVVLEALLGKDHPDYKNRRGRWARRLLKNGVKYLIQETRKEVAGQPQAAAVAAALGYFERNVDRMQYGTFRKQGWFIGSGVVEAGCKTVIGARCKQSGMFWSKPGAENILAVRCLHRSGQLDNFWKHRLNNHAARNDTLTLTT
jgi:hypothetical protein